MLASAAAVVVVVVVVVGDVGVLSSPQAAVAPAA
jgi:hypothetical protein